MKWKTQKLSNFAPNLLLQKISVLLSTTFCFFFVKLEQFFYSIKEVAEQSGIIRQQGHQRDERYRQKTRPEGRSQTNNWRG